MNTLILSLMILTLTYGCGKHTNESHITSPGYQGRVVDRSTDLSLQVDESVSSIKLYEIPRNAWFKLPTTLTVEDGNAVGRRVKIYYNLLSSVDYEFMCTYYSAKDLSTLLFEKCESRDGQEIISNVSELENRDFPMDKGASLKMQLTNPAGTGIKIKSAYIVEWK